MSAEPPGRMSAEPPAGTGRAPGNPTEPLPVAQVNTGMLVVDVDGTEVGTVTEVKMAGNGEAAGQHLPAADADRLARAGYLRVAAGRLAGDLFVAAGEVAAVTEGDARAPGVVSLTVSRDGLTRAE